MLDPVKSGDYLVASGRNDGTARAYSTDDISVKNLRGLVGMAWESSREPGVKRVNAAVGLDHTEVLSHTIDRQQKEIDELRGCYLYLITLM